MLNFVIPTNRDDLLSCTTGQYHVEDVFSTRMIPVKLQEAKSSLLKGNGFITGDQFEVFFSVLSKFQEVDPTTRKLTWSILTKGCEQFSIALHNILDSENKDDNSLWNSSQRIDCLNALKMNVYLLVQMSDLYQSASRQNSISTALTTPMKGRKNTKAKTSVNKLGIDWECECVKSFQLLMNFVDLDIHRLWEAQLVEDEFTSLISNFCYKVLEDQAILKNKAVKTAVFHLLGCIIKKHNQSLSSSLKIVQLMQHFEHIASPMAEAVHLWVTTYKCKSLVAEILRELSHIEEKDLVRDTASTRTICSFLQEVCKVLPSEVLPHISLLSARMDEESYTMRNTVLGVFGEILIQCLNGEDLHNKAKSDRDQFLDILYDHANLDVTAFVRSRALQIFLSLVKEQVLPIKRCPKLVDLCVRLLLDKSNLVRKATVQLLEGLLRWNPFAATMPPWDFRELPLPYRQLNFNHETLLDSASAPNRPFRYILPSGTIVLPITVLKDGLDKAKNKLEEIQANNDRPIATDSQTNDNDKQNDGDAREDTSPSPDFNEDSPVEEKDPNDEEDSEVMKQQKVIAFLSDSVCFVEKFHEAVPVLCQLLRSRTQTDVLEAISFFTAAWEFKLSFAVQGIAEMLEQIWNEEQKIRDAVVFAYRELYFKQTGSSNSSSHSEQVADNMVMLAAGSGREKLEAVEALINEMHKSGDIPAGVGQVLWSRFVNPSSAFTMERGLSEVKQRKVIVQLLGMLANSKPSMLKTKLDVLVDVGLKEETISDPSDPPKELTDFELALHTCTTLLKLAPRKHEAGKYLKQTRYPNDHKMFTTITNLLIEEFERDSNTWVRFSFQAAGVLFHLSERPILLSSFIFNELNRKFIEHMSLQNPSGEVTDRLLTRLFALSGHFALKALIFIDGDVHSEIKRRRKLAEEKEEADKNKKKSKRRSKAANKSKMESNLEEEMGVGGATADDADQEIIKSVLETEIVGPDSLLGSITELLVRSCTLAVDSSNGRAIRVQLSASLALAKYMLVSAEFCEKHLRLFFTMLETSPHEGIRANLTTLAGDLCVRFPNLMEPWNTNIYARLTDDSTVVRIYAIKVLTNLILNDMIKVKGHVSEMAKCIADDDTRISMLAKRFFQELSKKGNSVYNVIPDIISRLSDPDVGVKDDVDFKLIMRFLFEYIQKDKQSESLVEKLCHRFKATRDPQQWRDLAFCLSLLNYSEKAVKKLIENFSFYSEMLRDEQVYFSFDVILNKSKKFAKPELKLQIEELEGKILDHHTQGVSEDESTAKAAEASRKHKLPRSQSVSQQPETTPVKKRRFSLIKDLTVTCDKLAVDPLILPSPSSRHETQCISKTSALTPNGKTVRKTRRTPSNKRSVASTRKATTRKKRRESFCSDDDANETEMTSVTRKTMTRKLRTKTAVKFSSDEDGSDFDDIKENLEALSFTVEDENDISTSGEPSTPIRRKQTPKRLPSRSVLRV